MSTTPESADMPLFLPAKATVEPQADDTPEEPVAKRDTDTDIAPLFQPPEIIDIPPRDEESDDRDDDEAEEEAAATTPRRRRRRGSRGGRGKNHDDDKKDERKIDGTGAEDDAQDADSSGDDDGDVDTSSSRRLRRRRRRDAGERARAEVTPLKGSTRLEAKRQRRREGRAAGRRRQSITEAEFLARREAVERQMVVREKDGLNQIAVLEDGILVEHYVARRTQTSMVGNVYMGKVQNVLPSMEAAFVDLGKGRNAVLYAGEVNWDAVGLDGQPKRIEQALSSGDPLMVQVTKDPIGHRGARLTSQVTLAGRYLVLVPSGAMTGISRKLPESERARLKRLLRDIVPDSAGVIVRTAAEGASEEQLRADVERLQNQWAAIEKKAKQRKNVPVLLKGEPELAVRVVRDVFNEDFTSLTISGDDAWKTLRKYVKDMAPDLLERLHKWKGDDDIFTHYRIDEQLAKGMDRKVWLPSGGSLVIDRTEAMTVIDVNTGRFTGRGGTLEETVTKNNIEAAEEIVRQLRLRDIGGIIVIDFIDMVLESNRDLVLRRLIECLGRDRTRHQVAEVTSLGLVQMTRKRVGEGLVEAFSKPCESCGGRGFHVLEDPVEKGGQHHEHTGRGARKKQKKAQAQNSAETPESDDKSAAERAQVRATLATIAAAAAGSKKTDDEKAGAEETNERAK
ncbi:MAG: Rne/Rng family ribonuclease, partial [Bowdeniella nasicola]|nr:Rne/Rng family ribonuclease [Bowdeniella nasicola]